MNLIAFDTETRGLDWWNPDQRAFLVSWATPEHPAGEVHQPTDERRMKHFLWELEAADVVIGHNLGFDIHQLRETCGIDLLTSGKQLVDTSNLARVVLPERGIGDGGGYKLKDLATTYVDRGAQDSEQAIIDLAKQAGIKLKDVGGYYDTWRAYPDEMEFYAREDARITLALYHKLIAKLNDSNRATWELEAAVFPILVAAEQRGVALDQSKVGPLKFHYEGIADDAYTEVVCELGAEALEGTDALKEALIAHGVPLHRETPTGELATNQFALQEFVPDFPVLKHLMDWRTATKFLSTYIEPMVDRDTVHPSFWQMGAWTGRMSCSRPNMQNIPVRAGSEVREVFVPREGNVFVVHDYDSIELKLLAYYLNDEGFKQLVRDGVDVFARLAAVLWGGDEADYHKGTPGQSRRGDAKNVTYAITYGAGKARITDMLDLDPYGIVDGRGGKYPASHPMVLKGWAQEGAPMHEPANQIIKTVKSWLPNYHKLNKRIRNKIEATGYVTTLMGRRQPVKRDKAYVGLNAIIQGSAADIFKAGAIHAAEALQPLGFQPVLFVHDELVSEGPA
ncbi:MAG: DNA polymerase, partial [Mycobacteriaceae bacterium]